MKPSTGSPLLKHPLGASVPCGESLRETIEKRPLCSGLDYTGPNRQMRYGLALRRAYKWTEVSYPKRWSGTLEVFELDDRVTFSSVPIVRN